MKSEAKTVELLHSEIESLKQALEEKNNFCIESHVRFEKALMASPDSVCIIDVDTHQILELNVKFEETFGFKREEVMGKASLKLKFWANRDDRNRLVEIIKKKDSVKDFETEIYHKNGKTLRMSISAESILSSGQKCFIVYFRSITELRETEDHYKLLAENSTDVIWILNLEGYFTYISPSVEKLRGFTAEEVLKQSMKEVMTESSVEKVKILMESFIRQDNTGIIDTDSFLTEIEQTRKDGSTVWTEVIVTPIRNEQGGIKEVLGVSRNIQGKKIAEQKASERLKTVEGIFRSAPLGMGMTIDRNFEAVNEQFCKMLGYTRKEILGKSGRLVYDSDEEYERVGKVKYDFIKETGIGKVYTTLRKKNGRLIDVLMSSSPIDTNDWSKGVVFNTMDLSGIKEVESKLAEHEEKYTSFFNHINDAILVHPWKEEGFSNFIEVNDVACELYGYSREELLNMTADSITIPTDNLEHKSNEFRAPILEEGSMMFESLHVRKDGSRFPVEISSNIITVNKQVIILAVVRDITERKKALKAIEESELRYREMFENSPEAMITVNKYGFITDCNKAFHEITGRPPAKVLNKHFAKLNILSVKDIPQYLNVFSNLLVKKEKSVVDLDWIDVAGNSRKGVAHIGPIYKNNSIVGMQALLKDTTLQKEFENNLILAKEQAEESDRLKSSFLETMSHELRTPLNAVIGFSNLIKHEEDLQSIQEMNTYVTENGKKLLNIIESIFDISILETQATLLKTEEFSIHKLFEDLEITLRGLIELEQKSDINTYFQPDKRHEDFKLVTDKQRLKQLLSNLLTNAVRYTDKGSIRYGYSQKNNEIEFFVTDTGIGIPANKQKYIFNKFSQVDGSSTRTRGGLGLGLSIVDEISRLLGGSVRVESQLDVGSSFFYSMPIKAKTEIKKTDNSIDLSNKNFLIVEDVESNYLYLERLLTDSGGTVLWAQTGKDAIAIAEKLENIDMILMDIRIPDMDGYEITKRIKKIRPEIPIIAQTAYAMTSDREDALEAGCSDHISKPIRAGDLMAMVGKYLEPKSNLRVTI